MIAAICQAVVVGLFLIVPLGTAIAQLPKSPKSEPRTSPSPTRLERVVDEYKQQVRGASPSRGVERGVDDQGVVHVHPGSSTSKFDAYVTATGAVRFFGTQEEHFQFEKCMDKSGIPLKDK